MTRLDRGGNKYNARKTWSSLCQRIFDSKAEAEHGEYLWARQKNGEIHHLDYQVKFVLNEEPRCTLTIDFRYIVGSGEGTSYYVYEDVKGFCLTKKRKLERPRVERDFKVKLAWLKQLHGIEVKLVGGKHG